LNAIFNLPIPLRIGLVAILLVSLWLVFSDDAAQTSAQTPQVARTSDYSMTDFTMTIMNANGEPARVIMGDEMAHYPQDDSTEIINPVADFIEEGKDTWVVSSEKGHTTGKGHTILLTRNVIITNKNNPAFNMLTEKLTLDNQYNTAYTDEHVTIRTPHGDTESVGLHVDLNDETINLHSRVKGHYDAPAQ
jgi:lipopolysaccharide export system protein LptC